LHHIETLTDKLKESEPGTTGTPSDFSEYARGQPHYSTASKAQVTPYRTTTVPCTYYSTTPRKRESGRRIP